MEEEKRKYTIEDELETYQHVDEERNTRTVQILLDESGDGSNQIDVQLTINDEGEWQLQWLSCGPDWRPTYYFSKVGGHVRMTQVREHCNMIPPDFEKVDIIGMTPTEPNEQWRTYGVEDFKSEYEWSMEHQEWRRIEDNKG